MSLAHHTHPDQLERYSFLWNEVRLLIAALALFIGGVPPILYFLPVAGLYGLASLLLKLSWLLTGVTAVYLAYRWFTAGQKLFGRSNSRDTLAFAVMVISGINLGLVGLIGNNVGMSISSSYPIFVITAIAYVVAAYHLHSRWKSHGERLF